MRDKLRAISAQACGSRKVTGRRYTGALTPEMNALTRHNWSQRKKKPARRKAAR